MNRLIIFAAFSTNISYEACVFFTGPTKQLKMKIAEEKRHLVLVLVSSVRRIQHFNIRNSVRFFFVGSDISLKIMFDYLLRLYEWSSIQQLLWHVVLIFFQIFQRSGIYTNIFIMFNIFRLLQKKNAQIYCRNI